ncbi:tRNA 5-methoxyuridine(34)/uridine 5-oxyacetic acid(34) synthase CmoB [Tolumonas osonensis]|uniref:tRNA U34 carboxymethyltransferase n=1 Tax=Tolumonas osonensis TaxID=675874 RepID=A0A841GL08_9GAMM|nr:tRNA 5-methoxyuridine(34)/uridine 5-oxyacetic acid(34) synthase CmoB [Tolumonas osonensis]MBB6054183.1 tRNA (mo5U34)-methyltransferase [Tolumonas osonensis]
MIDFASFYQVIAKSRLSHWLHTLPAQLNAWENSERHGNLPKWQRVLKKLESYHSQNVNLHDRVEIGLPGEISDGHTKKLENLLQSFHPWRKGPFDLFGIHIDTEWRSDWKWDRVLPHISPLKNRYVLDVGCGSGYHLWRMRGEGAELAVGIDPSALFLCQFTAVKQLGGNDPQVHFLPLGIQELPPLRAFDTVFSMGVLYHRRSPIDHLYQLKDQLRDGGELVLETLIVDGDENTVLVPDDRYAQMNNVWFLPSPAAMIKWLKKCGFQDVRMVDEAITTTDEQRKTEWMRNDSLAQYLMPDDPTRTIEGYPAPKRAVFVATRGSED